MLSLYSIIAGWAVDYSILALRDSFHNASPGQINTLFANLISEPWRLLLWHTLFIATTIYVVGRGVQEGLEWSVRLLFPIMLGLLFILILYAAQTGHFGTSLNFLFQPNVEKLTRNSVLIALGHAFFTLSIATGAMMVYGSYLSKDMPIIRTSVMIAVADTLIALLAGLAIFPFVFAYHLEAASGPGLIFQTLRLAFGHIPYGGFFAALFFIMLVFAAFTSAISLLEPAVSWAMEKYKWTRHTAALIIGGAIWFFGLGSLLSFNLWAGYTLFGLNFFDLADYVVSNILLPLGGILIAIFVGWKLNKQQILEELSLSYQLALRSLGLFCATLSH